MLPIQAEIAEPVGAAERDWPADTASDGPPMAPADEPGETAALPIALSRENLERVGQLAQDW